MAKKPNSRQRANDRRGQARANSTNLSADLGSRRRVPLAGFSGLYEITRDGHVYSVRARRFVKWAYYDNGPYIKIQVGGQSRSLSIRDAIDESWANVPPQLYRIDIPATTIIVYARDECQALTVALNAARDEARDRRVSIDVKPVHSAGEVPSEWLSGEPYSDDEVAANRTVSGILNSTQASNSTQHRSHFASATRMYAQLSLPPP